MFEKFSFSVQKGIECKILKSTSKDIVYIKVSIKNRNFQFIDTLFLKKEILISLVENFLVKWNLFRVSVIITQSKSVSIMNFLLHYPNIVGNGSILDSVKDLDFAWFACFKVSWFQKSIFCKFVYGYECVLAYVYVHVEYSNYHSFK